MDTRGPVGLLGVGDTRARDWWPKEKQQTEQACERRARGKTAPKMKPAQAPAAQAPEAQAPGKEPQSAASSSGAAGDGGWVAGQAYYCRQGPK